jgi:orotate phosphoribosyltransferase
MLYCWPLTMTADGSTLIADEILDVLGGFQATQIAAYGVGSMPLMVACVLRGRGGYTGLTVREEIKRYGACRQIEGATYGSQRVVLVDDSINSGTSLMAGVRILEGAGYTVEGAVCLVNFSCGGGVERARARGYRVVTLFDIWDDVQMPRPDRPPLYLRHMPERWSDERVPDGLHPACVARRVAEHLIATGEVLRPPARFAQQETGPGGVWVSFRRRDDDRRLAREGFWHFDPHDADPTRDVVIATAGTVRALGASLTPQVLDELKIAVTFFSELNSVEPRDLDFRRYGVVVRSRHIPAKMGGALPNTQLFTSSFEQYRHARVTNARIGAFEPHEVFIHDVRKRVEPG